MPKMALHPAKHF